MPHVETEGGRLYYESHGDGDGPPLLLAMGIGGSCRGWLPVQVPEFSQQRRTLIFDYPGVGGSDPREGDFSTGDLAEVMDGLLAALQVPTADVLGVFMGGMVAQELALRHPERVRRLVLVGTYARPDAKRRMLLTQWRDLARIDAPLEVLIRDRLLWTAQDETIEQTDLIEAMIDFFKRDGAPLTADLFARQCEACLRHDTLERLGGIAHPTLVICGRNDLLTPPALHQTLADGIPNAKRVTIASGAHLVMVESGETFNRSVLQFLNSDSDAL
jgi:pimeloyl-ACP methyl ester carboxylesterase